LACEFSGGPQHVPLSGCGHGETPRKVCLVARRPALPWLGVPRWAQVIFRKRNDDGTDDLGDSSEPRSQRAPELEKRLASEGQSVSTFALSVRTPGCPSDTGTAMQDPRCHRTVVEQSGEAMSRQRKPVETLGSGIDGCAASTRDREGQSLRNSQASRAEGEAPRECEHPSSGAETCLLGQRGDAMISFVFACVLMALGAYVIYRELFIEPVVIVQIVTGGVLALLIGASWIYFRARQSRSSR